jgi:uncharacterized repeat protein (TIGR02543 family)
MVTMNTAFSDDAVIYAQWTLITYTVTFNANGGAVNAAFGTTGEGWTLASLPVPTRTGYTFNGWFTDAADCTEVSTSTAFTANTTIYAQWTIVVSVASGDRVIPGGPESESAVVTPVGQLSGEFTAGPNPVSRSSGRVDIFRHGKPINDAVLTVYGAFGNAVAKVNLRDTALGAQSRRQVGSWDLKDGRGRLVSEGTYLLRGVVTTSDGKRERVSVVVGVR